MKTNFLLEGTFESPIPSNKRLLLFITHLSLNNFVVYQIIIYTTQSKATFFAKNSKKKKEISLKINFKEAKTPVTGKESFFLTGRSRVRGIRKKIAESTNKAILSRDGKANLGAGFIGFDAVDKDSINRGIGFHGHAKNTLEPTDGCIRMYNDDILLLAPYLNDGIRVYIF